MRSYPHVCTDCGQVEKLSRALAFWCPACQARPGEQCVNVRTARTVRTAVSYLHGDRQALVADADRVYRDSRVQTLITL